MIKNNIFQRASTVITRPADTTAYASGDLVANSVTAGSVIPFTMPVRASQKKNGHFKISRIRLKKSGAVLTNASFRVHFYQSAPGAPTNGDNGAWLTAFGNYIGFIDVTIDRAFSDGATGVGTVAAGAELLGRTGTGGRNVWALLEARAAYAPASAETFQILADVSDLDQDANA